MHVFCLWIPGSLFLVFFKAGYTEAVRLVRLNGRESILGRVFSAQPNHLKVCVQLSTRTDPHTKMVEWLHVICCRCIDIKVT